ncbi:hypothetical protein RA2_01646 [Roseovarius sp. A-2]|uniref:integrase core domain-containing protein n=1 Tax=Roseovarius sp. A-2 TaxID=1570360 RepID=UPI0009B50441|nr:hypothetical protein RA2_01646 [Roseovarius sp. A-2]
MKTFAPHLHNAAQIVNRAVPYLRAFEIGVQAREGIGKRLAYYNAERPHSTHGTVTPDEVHAATSTLANCVSHSPTERVAQNLRRHE